MSRPYLEGVRHLSEPARLHHKVRHFLKLAFVLAEFLGLLVLSAFLLTGPGGVLGCWLAELWD